MWHTIGHNKAINTLTRSLAEGRIAPSYLITGPRQVGKMTLALDLARMVNCTGDDPPCGQCGQCTRIESGLHADVRVVGLEAAKGGEGKRRVSISIDQVRDVQKEASLKPYEGKYRVFIFDGAEFLSEEAANCLLKILEEPPDQVAIVLVSTEAAAMLTTIVSRCQRLDLKPLPIETLSRELESSHSVDHEAALEMARLSGGRLGWALNIIEHPELLQDRAETLEAIENTVRGGLEDRFAHAADMASTFSRDRESVRSELRLWLGWWRDVLVVKEDLPHYVTNLSKKDALQSIAQGLTTAQIAGAIGAIQKAADQLERNVNSRLALEGMMLSIPRL